MIQNSQQRLSVVPKELPDPPYSKDTSAKGYGFDLDVQRMQNSDSWAICPSDIRPWMIMSWVISWGQFPCGSLPSDDEILAVRLGCTMEFLQVHRRFIMRGWVLHADGRFYHPVVTEEVMKMILSREKWKIKKSGQRPSPEKQELSKNVPRESPGNPQSVPGVSPPSLSLSPSPSPSKEEECTNVHSSKPAAHVVDMFDGGGEKKSKIPPCPHKEIIDLYHEVLPELKKVCYPLWEGSREAGFLAARWKESPKHQNLEFWRKFFETVRTDNHWMRRTNTDWEGAHLRWLVIKRNFISCVEKLVDLNYRNGHG